MGISIMNIYFTSYGKLVNSLVKNSGKTEYSAPKTFGILKFNYFNFYVVIIIVVTI